MIRVVDLDKENRKSKKWFIVVILLLMIASGSMLYLWWDQDVNFEAYKTDVGKTASNSLGRLTLNEVIIDDNQILLNATFEPGKSLSQAIKYFSFRKFSLMVKIIWFVMEDSP